MQNTLKGLAGTALCLALASAHAAPKALLIGIDGAQLEKVQALNLPNFKRLNMAKGYTGGVAGSASEQETYSGPGWATILTGVWRNKHQISSNSDGLANPAFPSLFKRLRDAYPQAYLASVTNWGNINKQFFANDIRRNNYNAEGLSDEAVVAKTVELINTTPADFIFVHLDDPDHVGHDSGFGPAYDKALRQADAHLGRLLDAVATRQGASGDNWLVLATTDHGRDPVKGQHHGAQTRSEKTVFIASNQPMNAEFTSPVSTVANPAFDGLYGHIAQTWIAPTVLRHMGIEPQRSWLLDGAPLQGSVGVRKLLPASGAANGFSWAASSGQVEIYRNQQLLATVPGSQQSYVDTSSPAGLQDYTLLLGSVPVSLRMGRPGLRTALDWSASRSYFFLDDGSYVRYNQTDDKADSGYPKRTNNSSWPGLGSYAGQLAASFSKDANTAYFFLGNGQYVQYDKVADKALPGYPQPVSEQNWPGLAAYATQIKATLRLPGNKVAFFLKDGRFIRYDLAANRADGGPQAMDNASWPQLGVDARRITAALKWDDSRAYFFLDDGRYIRYNLTQNRAEANFPKPINSQTWPGLLP